MAASRHFTSHDVYLGALGSFGGAFGHLHCWQRARHLLGWRFLNGVLTAHMCMMNGLMTIEAGVHSLYRDE